jgi:hypothetical protein
MNGGNEVERRDRRGEDIDQPKRPMTRHQMPAALPAIFPLAQLGLLERRDVLDSGCNLYRFRLPEAEGIDRTSRPGAARPAMAIPHRLRRAGDFEFNGSAKAASCVTHDFHLSR